VIRPCDACDVHMRTGRPAFFRNYQPVIRSSF
jgi:hypothetical protein